MSPPVRAGPPIANGLPGSASVLINDPFRLEPPVLSHPKRPDFYNLMSRGNSSDRGLLSRVLGDSRPSVKVSWDDMLRFDWEIRKVNVTRGDRPPWQDILERWGPTGLKAGSFYNIAVREKSEGIMVVNAAIYPNLGLMVIKNPKEASFHPPLTIGEIYFQCLRYVQRVSGAPTLVVNQVLMVGLDTAATSYFTGDLRAQALAAHPQIDALYIPRVSSGHMGWLRKDSGFLAAIGTNAVVAISKLLAAHPEEMEKRIIEAVYVGSVQGYLLIDLVKVSVSVSAKIL